MRFAVLAGLYCLLWACTAEPVFHTPETYPQRLSAWGLLDSDLTIADGSYRYELNTPLFSDYASKLRTLYLPAGGSADYQAYEAFDFPPGTIVSKTFYFNTNSQGQVILDEDSASSHQRLIETRLLIRQADGWDALPYVWQGDDAYLAITGDLIRLPTADDQTINYLVPSKNQCASCHATNHTTGAIQPIGLKARHLHRPSVHGAGNQLQVLQQRGWLNGLPELTSVPASAVFSDPMASIEQRARAYLDINCGHCHNPAGAADTSGLLLDHQTTDARQMGECKPPIAAGRGSGGLNFSIVPGQADQSILAFRMASTDPAAMMPELGRTLVHEEGVSLIRAWINGMQGQCR
ncbi:MAG: SO2930 family diheme c-type cytochrome [Pseudomonadales bacterium]